MAKANWFTESKACQLVDEMRKIRREEEKKRRKRRKSKIAQKRKNRKKTKIEYYLDG